MRPALIAAALAAASPAFAAPQFFTGFDANPGPGASLATNPNADAAFGGFVDAGRGVMILSSPPPVLFDGFESFSTGATAPLDVLSGRATLTGGAGVIDATRASPTLTGNYAIEGTQSFFMGEDTTSFQLSFPGGVLGFGFYVVDIEALNLATLATLTVSGVATEHRLSDLLGVDGGGNGSVAFIGLLDRDDPILAAGVIAARGDSFNIDLLAAVIEPIDPIPSPASLGLFGLMAAMLTTRLHRRRMA